MDCICPGQGKGIGYKNNMKMNKCFTYIGGKESLHLRDAKSIWKKEAYLDLERGSRGYSQVKGIDGRQIYDVIYSDEKGGNGYGFEDTEIKSSAFTMLRLRS